MNSIRFFLLVFLNVSLFSVAQVSLLPSIGVQIPMGKWADNSFLGSDFGATINAKFGVSETMDLGIAAGYHRFSSDFEKQNNNMIPVVFTIENRFGDAVFKPVLELDLGVYNFYTSFIDVSDKFQLEVSKTSTKLGIAPAVGFFIDLSDSYALCAMAKYHYVYDNVTPMAYFGINIGLNIRFVSNGPRYSRF
jgi:hypothetical protein